MKRVIAFADEFGNNSFDFENQGSHFIITSIIMNEDELPQIQEQLETIRKKFFQTGEIKSSKVNHNHKRRILILNELKAINYSVYAVIIDKRKLVGEGFKFELECTPIS